VAEQKLYTAPGGWLDAAVDMLCAAGMEVIGPTEVEPGVVDLAPIASAKAIALTDGTVRLPLKRFFLPITEVLLDFENGGDGDMDVRPAPLPSSDGRVVIGVRPCDTAAVEAMDKVFQWDYDDLRYRARREQTTLVTFACTQAAPECFCTSVGGSPHGTQQSDLLVFFDAYGAALLQVLSDKGDKLLGRLGDIARPAPGGQELPDPPDVEPKFDPEKVKSWLDENFENDFWAEGSLGCLGCGACSCLCPTCHCFDSVDEATWNHGQRRRNWDCCAFSVFTLHASGHNPRRDPAARYRQRLMHKFKYFPERFGRIGCVGCGRCAKACGVGRDLVTSLSGIESM
jgi:formate hydrogenlyase subunit 6/NADH:ubiquinone oxidoreductase subunit I